MFLRPATTALTREVDLARLNEPGNALTDNLYCYHSVRVTPRELSNASGLSCRYYLCLHLITINPRHDLEMKNLSVVPHDSKEYQTVHPTLLIKQRPMPVRIRREDFMDLCQTARRTATSPDRSLTSGQRPRVPSQTHIGQSLEEDLTS